MARWKLHAISDFERQSAAWDDLNRRGPDSPLLSALFFQPLLKEFGRGDEVLAICGGSNPEAMAILQPHSRFGWQTFQPSQAPVGAWLQVREANTEELARSLVKALSGFALALGITQLDPDLIERPANSGMLETFDYIQTARISINSDFEGYWTQRGKNLRHNLKRQRNQLIKLGIECRVDAVTRPEDIAPAVADYSRLETAGWKAETGTAVRSDDAQGRFYTQLLETHCAAGKGRIYRIWLDGKLAATDLCVDDGKTLVILKTSYDESVTNVSPAPLMREDYFRCLFESGLRRIEFYGKLMEWHTKWSDEIRTMYHINCYRSAWVPALKRFRQKAAAKPQPAD